MAQSAPSNPRRHTKKPTGWPRPSTPIARQMGLNPYRMGFLVVLALAGVFGGYFIGKYYKPAPPGDALVESARPAAAPAAKPPEHYHEEEQLPRDIVIQTGATLKRIALPEPDAELDLGGWTALNGSAKDTAEPSESKAEPPISAAKPETPTATVLTAAMPADIAELQRTKSDSLPAWQRYAQPVTRTGKPAVVIVIDDMGLNSRRANRTVALPGPLTLSYLSYADGLKGQFAKARAGGHETMLHVPMEPRSESIDPGPNVLLSGIPRDELIKSIAWNLDQTDGYVGINNHMGSRFTADVDGMLAVSDALKARGLLFLDSVTSGRTVAHDIARETGIPFAVRNVFIDHEDDLATIERQLATLERIAKRTGLAIAIGHPRDNTLKALEKWLPTVEERGMQLLPVSAVVTIAAEG